MVKFGFEDNGTTEGRLKRQEVIRSAFTRTEIVPDIKTASEEPKEQTLEEVTGATAAAEGATCAGEKDAGTPQESTPETVANESSVSEEEDISAETEPAAEEPQEGETTEGTAESKTEEKEKGAEDEEPKEESEAEEPIAFDEKDYPELKESLSAENGAQLTAMYLDCLGEESIKALKKHFKKEGAVQVEHKYGAKPDIGMDEFITKVAGKEPKDEHAKAEIASRLENITFTITREDFEKYETRADEKEELKDEEELSALELKYPGISENLNEENQSKLAGFYLSSLGVESLNGLKQDFKKRKTAEKKRNYKKLEAEEKKAFMKAITGKDLDAEDAEDKDDLEKIEARLVKISITITHEALKDFLSEEEPGADKAKENKTLFDKYPLLKDDLAPESRKELNEFYFKCFRKNNEEVLKAAFAVKGEKNRTYTYHNLDSAGKKDFIIGLIGERPKKKGKVDKAGEEYDNDVEMIEAELKNTEFTITEDEFKEMTEGAPSIHAFVDELEKLGRKFGTEAKNEGERLLEHTATKIDGMSAEDRARYQETLARIQEDQQVALSGYNATHGIIYSEAAMQQFITTFKSINVNGTGTKEQYDNMLAFANYAEIGAVRMAMSECRRELWGMPKGTSSAVNRLSGAATNSWDIYHSHSRQESAGVQRLRSGVIWGNDNELPKKEGAAFEKKKINKLRKIGDERMFKRWEESDKEKLLKELTSEFVETKGYYEIISKADHIIDKDFHGNKGKLTASWIDKNGKGKRVEFDIDFKDYSREKGVWGSIKNRLSQEKGHIDITCVEKSEIRRSDIQSRRRANNMDPTTESSASRANAAENPVPTPSEDTNDQEPAQENETVPSMFNEFAENQNAIKASEDELKQNLGYSERELDMKNDDELKKYMIETKKEIERFARERGMKASDFMTIPDNKILTKLDDHRAYDRNILRRELIRSACTAKKFTDSDGKEVAINFGYQNRDLVNDKKSFQIFNNALIAFTSWQIALQHNEHEFLRNDELGDTESARSYRVILLAELGDNMAVKIRNNPEKIKDAKIFKDPSHVTQEEVIGYLQAGMFESDPKHLEIIGELYDSEDVGFNAVEALSKMGRTTQDAIKIAELFGLTDAVNKMKQFQDKKEININIAGNII